MKNNRTLALEWWKAMTIQQQRSVVDEWKKISKDSRNEWSFEMISMSSSTIQLIWSEMAESVS